METFVAARNSVLVEGEDDRSLRLLDPELRNGYFETEDRPARDGGWKLAYVLANLLVIAGGVAAICYRDKNFELHASPDYLGDATHCAENRSLLQLEEEITSGKNVAMILVGGIVSSLALGFSFTYLLKKQAMAAVLVSVLSEGALFLIIGVAALTDNTDSVAGIMFLVLAALWLLLPVLCWSRLKLVSRLLTVAGDGLAANPSLLGVCLSMIMAGFVFIVMQFTFLIFGAMNGSVVPNTDVDKEGALPCRYSVDTWAHAYMLFTAVVVMWTSSLCMQMNVFAIAGTISQWYFAPAGSSTRGTTMRSLRYAFGPSFGSLCLSAAVMVLINVMRNALYRLRQKFGICCSFIFQVPMLLSAASLPPSSP
mmetsp:Transcript_359/g.1108  ORF Transcript_359/g.1108 Transcript_359/m.1108 type:complete len:367 (-) Transcript_359:1092-2192(-)